MSPGAVQPDGLPLLASFTNRSNDALRIESEMSGLRLGATFRSDWIAALRLLLAERHRLADARHHALHQIGVVGLMVSLWAISERPGTTMPPEA